MDKETLSHYGWIVVLILILSVMIALATPLGQFIANGFKATYVGFGNVNNEALGIFGNTGNTGGAEKEPDENASVYALVLDNATNTENTTPMIFIKSNDAINVGDEYNSDTYGTKTVTAVFTDFVDKNFNASSNKTPWYDVRSTITSVVVEDTFTSTSLSSWFSYMSNCKKADMSKFDASKLTNLMSTFTYFGSDITTEVTITGIQNWDVSHVTNFYGTFTAVGYSASNVIFDNIKGWNTSSALDMTNMFSQFAYSVNEFNLDISGWKLAPDSSHMFQSAGEETSGNVTLNVSNCDTSAVTDMQYIFNNFGYETKGSLTIIGLDTWKMSSVKNMSSMFYNTGYNASEWNIGNITSWDTSSATNMGGTFSFAGYKASYNKIDLSGWDVSNVTYSSFFNQGVESKITKPSF